VSVPRGCLPFSICNKFLGLKRQLILPTYTEYQTSREAFIKAREAFLKGRPDPIPEFRANLSTITPIWLPTESLEKQIFERISIQGRALAASVELVGAIDALDKSIQYRNDLIVEIKQQSPMPPLQLALRYYGLRAQGDIIDDRFQSNIQALHAQTDDCIFFARKLADDLFNYGTRLRRRNAWKYRLGIPKMVREDWKFVDKGLMPDESLYANWLRGFVKQPSRIERLRKRFLAPQSSA
jgi:hypothetical protein